MPAIDDYETALVAVETARAAGNWADAHNQIAAAEIALARLLIDSTTSEGTTDSLRKNLDSVSKAIEKAEARVEGANWIELRSRHVL